MIHPKIKNAWQGFWFGFVVILGLEFIVIVGSLIIGINKPSEITVGLGGLLNIFMFTKTEEVMETSFGAGLWVFALAGGILNSLLGLLMKR